MNQRGEADILRSSEAVGSDVRSDRPRVAFFGGSFDPPHLGHLAIARAASAAFALDAVLFAPVGMQPLKPEGPAASFEDRLEMTRLAIAGEPRFEISLVDAPKLQGAPTLPDAPFAAAGARCAPNYTIDTLEDLRASLAPGGTLYCLMGADSFFGLRAWRRAAELPFVAPLIVASRPGQPLEGIADALPPELRFERLPAEDRAVSGVEVRGFALMNDAGDRAPLYVLRGLHVEVSASEIRSRIRTQMQAALGDTTSVPDLVPAAVLGYIREHGLYRT